MAKIEKGMTLKFAGSANANNATNRFYLDRGEPERQNLELFVGETVEVGKDVTKTEAEQLLRNPDWKFEMVGK